MRKIFRKTSTCPYQGIRNISFSENSAYVFNRWLLLRCVYASLVLTGLSLYNLPSECNIILVRIFPHLNRIRRDTFYVSLFSPNAGKKRTRITSNTDSFHALNFSHSISVNMKLTGSLLTLSWRRPLSHRNQSIDLRSKSMDWLLCDNGLRHERVNNFVNNEMANLVLTYSETLPNV